MKKRFFAVFLTAVMICSAMPTVFAGDVLPERDHGDLSYEELRAMEYDHQAFLDLADEIKTRSADSANKDTLSGSLSELREAFLLCDTMSTIRYLDTYRDVTDVDANEAYIQSMDQYYEASEVFSDTLQTVYLGPCSDALDTNDDVFSAFLWADYGDEGGVDEAFIREQNLIDSYYAEINEDVSMEYQGQTHWFYNLDYEYSQGLISRDDYSYLYDAFTKLRNEKVVDDYLELVSIRKEYAQEADCSSVSDYYDSYCYYRDCSDTEREDFYGSVKKQIVPLAGLLYDALCEMPEDYSMTPMDSEEVLSSLRTGLEQLSPELLPALDYMTEYGYYDMEASDEKANTGFTTLLTYTNSPYIFNCPTGTISDFSDTVHEFGHYTAYFCASSMYDVNLDLSEVHSQGLELLMLSQYETLLGEKASWAELNTVYNMLISMIDGCLYDELEQYAYAEENLTAEKMNRKYMSLLKEYGYKDADDPTEEAYDWTEIPHLFEQPFYYISYGISAAAAFSIWETAQGDLDAGVDQYLRLVSQGESGYFTSTLHHVGIDNPLSETHMMQLALELTAAYGMGTETAFSLGNMSDIIEDVSVILYGGYFAAMVISGLAVLIFLRKHKKEMRNYRDKTGN